MDDQRIMPCPECGGDGGFECPTGTYSHIDGSLHTVWRECRACDGAGDAEVTVQPITMEDLTMEEALRLDEEKLIAIGAYDGREAS